MTEKPCPACRGTGKITTFHGGCQAERQSTCPMCKGKKKVPA